MLVPLRVLHLVLRHFDGGFSRAADEIVDPHDNRSEVSKDQAVDEGLVAVKRSSEKVQVHRLDDQTGNLIEA